MRTKIISKNVLILSFVSLFTDVASEMLYPIMPIYLTSIGFSIVLIGVLEGVAEATAGLSKGYFGNLSDNLGKRLPFVRIGYGLSAVSKPMMAVFTYPFWVFIARALDRLGKGIRTGARDALLSDEATPATKGRVFGFHRSMDTLGAVLGPVAALVYLAYHPGHYKELFIIAFFPGLLAMAITFLIREKRKPSTEARSGTGFFDFIKYWKTAPDTYRKLAGALIVFALFNSSDVFLLLRIKEAGYTDATVISIYIFYNMVYAAASYPIGILADRIGMKKIFITGLFLFVLTYTGMAIVQNKVAFFGLFLLYGIYAAATEGIAKAWITNICEKNKTATAIGTYTAFQSIATMLASFLAGWIWFSFGPAATFGLSAAVAVMVALYITRIRNNT
ncbi:MAG: Major Facilitator Superfamily transporter [Sediminibacterium sp.]|nr:Major Facilitator Superfamily transporter [Sediminibacterium sp.]